MPKLSGPSACSTASTLWGAALGCVCAGFVLLPELGFLGTVRLGAVLNMLVGIVAGSLPIAKSGLARPRLLGTEERGALGGICAVFCRRLCRAGRRGAVDALLGPLDRQYSVHVHPDLGRSASGFGVGERTRLPVFR